MQPLPFHRSSSIIYLNFQNKCFIQVYVLHLMFFSKWWDIKMAGDGQSPNAKWAITRDPQPTGSVTCHNHMHMCTCPNTWKPDLEMIASTQNRLAMFVSNTTLIGWEILHVVSPKLILVTYWLCGCRCVKT